VPATARRASLSAALAAAAAGLVLLVLGVWAAIGLGPSGRAEFSSSRSTPGIVLVGSPVLGRVDRPVEVSVSRVDAGAVWLGVAHDADARAAIGSSPFLSVDRVHYPWGGVDAHVGGTGSSTAARLPGGDVWQQTSTGTGTARLVVQPGDVPRSMVAASGNAAGLGRVRVTLAWESRAWFLEALAVAAVGLVMTALALAFLRRKRRRGAPAPSRHSPPRDQQSANDRAATRRPFPAQQGQRGRS
jgi:hypothetical protein